MNDLITKGIDLNIVGILKYTSEDDNSEYADSYIYYRWNAPFYSCKFIYKCKKSI